ncbi:MAG TPA: T9SS type A sorting domain-containing protein [Bacteroidia bacterium]
MLRNNIFIAFFIIGSLTIKGQGVPVIGQTNRLEIGNWNLEWYGKTTAGYGPDNDSLQQKLIRNILDSTHIDIWGLCEIADTNAFIKSTQSISRYRTVFSDYFPEQKTAIMVDTNFYRIVSYRLLGTQSTDSFSTYRFPLEVNLIPKTNLEPDTITIIVLHLKSNIGNTTEKMQAYNSRTRSSEWLNMYLNQVHKNNYVAVIGDWNDDVDLSIYNNLPSPFNILTKNGSNFEFITKKLSNTNISSTVSYFDFIDHQLLSNKLENCNVNDTAFVIRADKWINQYGSKVSDHYPVYSSYETPIYSINKTWVKKLNVYPDPSSSFIQVESHENGQLHIINAQGENILNLNYLVGDSIYVGDLANGIYTLYLQTENTFFCTKFVVLK